MLTVDLPSKRVRGPDWVCFLCRRQQLPTPRPRQTELESSKRYPALAHPSGPRADVLTRAAALACAALRPRSRSVGGKLAPLWPRLRWPPWTALLALVLAATLAATQRRPRASRPLQPSASALAFTRCGSVCFTGFTGFSLIRRFPDAQLINDDS